MNEKNETNHSFNEKRTDREIVLLCPFSGRKPYKGYDDRYRALPSSVLYLGTVHSKPVHSTLCRTLRQGMT